MREPRYFGIALTLQELHTQLGLPSNVSIRSVSTDHREGSAMEVQVDLEGPSDCYDGATEPWKIPFYFRPDISTSTVSQVVIHPLKEK
jgi:hypothetical protein